MPHSDTDNGKWNMQSMIEFRERFTQDMKYYRNKPSTIEKHAKLKDLAHKFAPMKKAMDKYEEAGKDTHRRNYR